MGDDELAPVWARAVRKCHRGREREALQAMRLVAGCRVTDDPSERLLFALGLARFDACGVLVLTEEGAAILARCDEHREVVV